jgi:transcriptional regulator
VYIPAHFSANESPWCDEFMAATRAGTVVTQGEKQLHANLYPLLFDQERRTLRGHCARANPQWQDVRVGSETLVILGDVGAYVSPNFYPSKAEQHHVVPTWNYEAVHAYGAIAFHHDATWLLQLLHALTTREESTEPIPWQMADAPTEFIAGLLNHIVGFEIQLHRVEAKRKLSQNRSAADRWGTIAGLDARDHDPASTSIAASMKKLEP